METEACQRCLKPQLLCICEGLKTFPTRTHVLILQHPQEPDKELGTAQLTHLMLPNSTLRIGLSCANLKSALRGSEVSEMVASSPKSWAVLYLGSGKKPGLNPKAPLELVTKNAEPLPDSAELLKGLRGLVVLDGTWSQAKAIWWRNPWLLKLRRAILSPPKPSLYRELRKEPRRECLSTLESTAYALTALGEDPKIERALMGKFEELLAKKRG